MALEQRKGVFFTAGLVILALVVASLSMIVSQEKNEYTKTMSDRLFLSQVLDEERDLAQGIATIFHQKSRTRISTSPTGVTLSTRLSWPPSEYRDDVEWFLGLWNSSTGVVEENETAILYPEICFSRADPCYHHSRDTLSASNLGNVESISLSIQTPENSPETQSSTSPGGVELYLKIEANDTAIEKTWNIDPAGDNTITITTLEGSTITATINSNSMSVTRQSGPPINITLSFDTGVQQYRMPYLVGVGIVNDDSHAYHARVWAPL